MLRLMTGLAAVLMTGVAQAGELDREFAGKSVAAASTADTKAHSSANAMIPQPEGVEKPMTSELDQESPTQAYRGWSGGYWGGYRGFYGGYRWRGYYGYRPWGYYGWRRPWAWGIPYLSLGIGFPYFYPYPYYTAFSYGVIDYPYGALYPY